MKPPPAPLPPPGAAPLPGHEVHLWQAALDLPVPAVARLARSLSAGEAARAARFRFARHGRRFTVARAALRGILARYLGEEPQALRLAAGAQGKPCLAEGSGAADLRFNLAHSGERALLAVTRGCEIGVDLERLRPMPDAARLAARFFSGPEKEAVARLPAAEQQAAFFRCWVQKEAYIKATGRGLSQPLSGFGVTVLAGEPAGLHFVAGDPQEAGRWSLTFLEVPPGYVAALAVEGAARAVQYRQWLPSARAAH